MMESINYQRMQFFNDFLKKLDDDINSQDVEASEVEENTYVDYDKYGRDIETTEYKGHSGYKYCETEYCDTIVDPETGERINACFSMAYTINVFGQYHVEGDNWNSPHEEWFEEESRKCEVDEIKYYENGKEVNVFDLNKFSECLENFNFVDRCFYKEFSGRDFILSNVSENRIRRFIKGVIREALNEMDWRTYVSAGKKASKRGDDRRVYDFETHAEDAFNRDYGYSDHRGDYKSTGFYTDLDEPGYEAIASIRPEFGKDDFTKLNVHTVNDGDDYSSSRDNYFAVIRDYPNISKKGFYGKASKELRKAIEKGNKALDDYASGRTTYRSKNKGGKGWANYDED